MTRRIIIPAAGRAVRFNGLPKELLPTDVTECGLTRALRLARRDLEADVVIITNREKHVMHEQVLRLAQRLHEVEFREQNDGSEFWGAIKLGLERNRPAGVIMPDTVTSIAAAGANMAAAMQFGIFETTEPQRYSVVQSTGTGSGLFRIRTKEPLTGRHDAWGMVLWDAAVTNFFLDNAFDHYDRAFEAAARKFGYEFFPLSYYFDLGSFSSYLGYLALTHLNQP